MCVNKVQADGLRVLEMPHLLTLISNLSISIF